MPKKVNKSKFTRLERHPVVLFYTHTIQSLNWPVCSRNEAEISRGLLRTKVSIHIGNIQAKSATVIYCINLFDPRKIVLNKKMGKSFGTSISVSQGDSVVEKKYLL